MKRLLLLLPGPMQVPEEVAEAAKRPLFFNSYSKYTEFEARLRSRMQPVFGTTSDVLFLPSSGTGAMESAVVNLTSPAEEIIVMVGGAFAERWVKIGRAFGLRVHAAEVDWRVGASVDNVRSAMDKCISPACVC